MDICSNCEWWKTDSEKNKGDCRVNPPTVLPWMGNIQNPYDAHPIVATESYSTVWPETKSNDGCGKFRLKG